jgi:hypothetical protein
MQECSLPMRSEWLRGRREEMTEIRKVCDVGHRRVKWCGLGVCMGDERQ